MASTIILSDNGASSGSAGLKQTAGNDGVLILQTTTSGGTATNAIYVDTSQNVGVGVTPSAWGSSFKALQMSYATMMSSSAGGYYGANFYYNSSGNPIYVNNGYALAYSAYSAGGAHLLLTAPSGTAGGAITWTTSLTLEKDKSLALQGATSQSGTGITFPASQSASSDANTLDDYEEGSWTPVLYGGASPLTGGGTVTAVGRYTKIGRLVVCNFVISATSSFSGSGSVFIYGLPFNAANNNSSYANYGVLVRSVNFTSYCMLEANPAGNMLTLMDVIDSGNATPISVGLLGTTFSVNASVSYFVD